MKTQTASIGDFGGLTSLLLPLLLNPLKVAKPFSARWLWAVSRPQVPNSHPAAPPPSRPIAPGGGGQGIRECTLISRGTAPLGASLVLSVPFTSLPSPPPTPLCSLPHWFSNMQAPASPGAFAQVFSSLGTSVAPPSASQSFADVSSLSPSPYLRLHDTHTHTHTHNTSTSRD